MRANVTVAVAKVGEPACEDIKRVKIKKREPYRDLGNAQVGVSTSPETDRASLEADFVVFSPTKNVKMVDDEVDPEQEHMQESLSAVTDLYFGKIGDVQGFMSDAWTNLISSPQTNKTDAEPVPEMADTANLMPPSYDNEFEEIECAEEQLDSLLRKQAFPHTQLDATREDFHTTEAGTAVGAGRKNTAGISLESDSEGVLLLQTQREKTLKLTAWDKPMPRKPSKGPEKGFVQV